ncbi:hypothetical protein [Nonomuraea sp. NPDC050643]|uniref:hypothetical protein n=1 Tax=Nonomuraea sp. NPDC050643 TaxID=3155660 RepID=UPI0033C76CCB
MSSLRYRAVAPGLRERGRIGSSTSHRIIAICCGRLGLDQSTPCPVQYDKYKAIPAEGARHLGIVDHEHGPPCPPDDTAACTTTVAVQAARLSGSTAR